MKKLKFIQLLLIVLAASFAFSSCKKDSANPVTAGGKVKVTYKIIGSADANITTIVYYDSSNSIVTKTGNFGSSWTSDQIEVNRMYAIVTAGADGASDASTLKAQIIQDGKVVKETSNSTGKILQAQVSLGN